MHIRVDAQLITSIHAPHCPLVFLHGLRCSTVQFGAAVQLTLFSTDATTEIADFAEPMLSALDCNRPTSSFVACPPSSCTDLTVTVLAESLKAPRVSKIRRLQFTRLFSLISPLGRVEDAYERSDRLTTTRFDKLTTDSNPN